LNTKSHNIPLLRQKIALSIIKTSPPIGAPTIVE